MLAGYPYPEVMNVSRGRGTKLTGHIVKIRGEDNLCLFKSRGSAHMLFT